MRPLFTSYLYRKRIEIIKPYLNGNVLDLGCGPAEIIRYLEKNQLYVGVDFDKVLIIRLKKVYPNYEFYCYNIDRDPIKLLKRKFCTILLTAIIEHLEMPNNILKQCYDLLNDEGNIVITTPTPFGGKMHEFGAILGLTSKSAVKHHHKFYSYQDMKNILALNGFMICKYHTFEFLMNQIFLCKKILR